MVLFPIDEDFDDNELVVLVMEFIHRDTTIVIGYFKLQFTLPPSHGPEIAVGNFRVTVTDPPQPQGWALLIEMESPAG